MKRIITIEDAAELQLQQEHVIRLESRPANIEGEGEIRARELVRNALRMRRTGSSSERCVDQKRSTCCRR